MNNIRNCDCKIGDSIDKYSLSNINDRLEAKWIDDHVSVRDLAAWFNKQILAAELEAHDVDSSLDRVDRIYDTLTDPDVTSGRRVEVENRLRDEGVSVESITSDFVSHQTVHNHLRECLSLDHPGDDRSAQARIRDKRETLAKLQGRTTTVSASTLERLHRQGDITLGEFEVFTDVQVLCRDCGDIHAVDTLLEQGGCSCDPTQ